MWVCGCVGVCVFVRCVCECVGVCLCLIPCRLPLEERDAQVLDVCVCLCVRWRLRVSVCPCVCVSVLKLPLSVKHVCGFARSIKDCSSVASPVRLPYKYRVR